MPWSLQDVLYIYERLKISGDLVSVSLKHVLHLFGQVFFLKCILMYFKSVYLKCSFLLSFPIWMENNRNLTHSRKDELSDWTVDDYVGVILKRFWLFILNLKTTFTSILKWTNQISIYERTKNQFHDVQRFQERNPDVTQHSSSGSGLHTLPQAWLRKTSNAGGRKAIKKWRLTPERRTWSPETAAGWRTEERRPAAAKRSQVTANRSSAWTKFWSSEELRWVRVPRSRTSAGHWTDPCHPGGPPGSHGSCLLRWWWWP